MLDERFILRISIEEDDMSATSSSEKITKPKRPRSTAYPNHNLETSIGFTGAMRDKLGSGPYSRELAAQALGHQKVTGTSSAKIAAAVHFGLLKREGNTYSQSEISNMIFSPETDEERSEGIRQAMLSPTLYQKLLAEYNGKGLPTMLDNILVRTYGLLNSVAKQAATDFKKSAEYAGLLVNGVINTNSGPETLKADDKPEINDEMEREITRSHALSAPSNYLTVVIPNTDVRIVFPPEYAYDLSIGTFGQAIKSLGKAVSDNKAGISNEQPDSHSKN